MNLALALFLGFGILFCIVGKLLFRAEERSRYNFEGGVILFLVLLFVASIASTLGIWKMYFEDHIKTKEAHYYYMKSLGNNTSISGDFFLGSGSIEEKEYYFFYVNTVKGMRKMKLPIDKTYIIETDDRRPEAVEIQEWVDDKDLFFKDLIGYTTDHYKLYVPKGTVIRDFKVR